MLLHSEWRRNKGQSYEGRQGHNPVQYDMLGQPNAMIVALKGQEGPVQGLFLAVGHLRIEP